MGKFTLFLISGGIAIVGYVCLILFFITHFNDSSKPIAKYTAFKETAFHIDFLEEQKPKIETKVSIKKAEPKVKDIPIEDKNTSKTPNVGLGINDLFQQVETKQPLKKEVLKPQSQDDKIAKKKQSRESIQKEDNLNSELEKILANLEVKKTMSFAPPKGEYDEFYAKVQEILYKNWNPIWNKNQYEAEVQISIDSVGKFSYSIVKFSGDLEFDTALQEFLDIMLTQKFPRYEGGNQTNIIVTFKTEV
ncbi:TonB C-terminal domain-containing protein [Helicobacter mesocricetorum]|uniref:TonB C-terminal domain-containing protein n=1 Tax=Helicobacter mesocricetorum TaxID=87012 RepID=UPI000CF01D70|nr:TonB C-terminal domain-containing protein [Helicobacter mesocricetorum]